MRGNAGTAHLAAILADPETVEAVAVGMFPILFRGRPVDRLGAATLYERERARDHARAAIAVLAERLGVQALSDETRVWQHRPPPQHPL